jgi:hypothetical protein
MKSESDKNRSGVSLEDVDCDSSYFLEIGNRVQQILEVVQNTEQNCLSKGLFSFIASCLQAFEATKEHEQASTLVTVQPNIGEFTYILHPMLIPIYAYFLF